MLNRKRNRRKVEREPWRLPRIDYRRVGSVLALLAGLGIVA
ncbi:MAG TPA: hypothetical protein VLT59_01840 [Steroidobacteraceae bacterium]|nr:hypothetical protein [Steroidobacteraceae bacterium]